MQALSGTVIAKQSEGFAEVVLKDDRGQNVAKVPNGETMTVLENGTDTVKVRWNKIEAWAKATNVKALSGTVIAKQAEGFAEVVLKDDRGQNVAKVPNGEPMTVLENGAETVKVRWNKIEGWAKVTNVKADSSGATTLRRPEDPGALLPTAVGDEAANFTKGEKASVWSVSKKDWTDVVVEEVFKENGVDNGHEIKAGMLKVRYCSGNSYKYVVAKDTGAIARKAQPTSAPVLADLTDPAVADELARCVHQLVEKERFADEARGTQEKIAKKRQEIDQTSNKMLASSRLRQFDVSEDLQKQCHRLDAEVKKLEAHKEACERITMRGALERLERDESLEILEEKVKAAEKNKKFALAGVLNPHCTWMKAQDERMRELNDLMESVSDPEGRKALQSQILAFKRRQQNDCHISRKKAWDFAKNRVAEDMLALCTRAKNDIEHALNGGDQSPPPRDHAATP